MIRSVRHIDLLARGLLCAALCATFPAAAPPTDPALGQGGSVASGSDGVGGIERAAGKVKPSGGNYRAGNGPSVANAPDDPVADPAPSALLGDGLPGEDGVPELLATFDSTALAGLHLSARPASPVVLVAGLHLLPQPLFGGWLFPAPQLVVTGLTTDAAGELQLALPPGALPPEATLFVQAWVADPTGPMGWTATPALVVGPLAALLD